MSALLVVHSPPHVDTGRVAAEEVPQWRTAHPELAFMPEDSEPIDGGIYSALLYISRLPESRRIHGYLRCLECGRTCVTTHRVFRVHRDDYAVVRIEVVDSQYLPHEMNDAETTLDPDRDIRGDSLAIEFRCDVGHGWFLEFGNHKGTTIASLSPASR